MKSFPTIFYLYVQSSFIYSFYSSTPNSSIILYINIFARQFDLVHHNHSGVSDVIRYGWPICSSSLNVHVSIKKQFMSFWIGLQAQLFSSPLRNTIQRNIDGPCSFGWSNIVSLFIYVGDWKDTVNNRTPRQLSTEKAIVGLHWKYIFLWPDSKKMTWD